MRPSRLDHLALAAEYTLNARRWWARLAEVYSEDGVTAHCALYHAEMVRCLEAARRHLATAKGRG